MEAFVQQLITLWTSLDLRRRIVVVGATIAMFFAILTMSKIAASPNMTLLYAGLETAAAGDVIQSIEQRGIAFEVRGGAIFVDRAERDQLRLSLASEGLPANSNNGYELLDQLSGFGTTSQMFDAAYWRAKEGELARTIVANTHIAAARVHIATTGSNPFQRGVNPKASISITSTNGTISIQQAKAIRFLVASAVSGLASEDVVVVDSNGNLIGSNDDLTLASAGDDKSKILRDRVQRLLEARVGFGNSVVEVSVETVTESEAIRERSFDPKGRVAISTDTEERNNTSSDSGNGNVTVASNLPDEGTGNTADSTSNNSETRERVNYEVSETEREVIRTPGAIKRLTVAVLVNDLSVKGENDLDSLEPRTDEELEALRELVSSAVGFDENRGDVITIKSMALQSIPINGTLPSSSVFALNEIDIMSAIQMAMLATVSLILGLFVIKPLVKSARKAGPTALIGNVAEGNISNLDLSEEAVGPESGNLMALPEVTQLPSSQEQTSPYAEVVNDDPVKRLEAMMGSRQEETVEILRGWLEEKEQRA
ncbi:MAG: flagellar basal-body MS-ring/collar protein FliF [Lentilitoribacter sp.]